MAFPGITFSTAVFTFQVVLLILFAVFVDYAPYDKNTSAIPEYYPLFQDVHVMIFVGFGFLMTFLKKYGYGAVSYNLFISAAVIQWAMLVSAWVSQAADKAKEPARVKLTVKNLITSDFTAGAVLITFGAILGKVSRLQLFAVGVFEVVFYAINELVLVHFLKVSDVGGSLVIHMFGAYFGLAVARVNYREDVAEGDTKEGSTVTSDLFSMIGTLFLWMYWPSFNGAMLGPGSQQQRAIINTYLSLVACTVMTFVVSPLVHKNFKLNMVHIQNATIAGGVAVGTCADLDIRPWGAILIGIAAGTLSVLGYAYVTNNNS